MARPLIQAEDLHKVVAGKVLLDGAAFQLERGERVALVGPNGCGKTTLLRMVLGEERPDAGTLGLAPRTPVVAYHQHVDIPKGATARDLLAAKRGVPTEIAAELAELEARMADPQLYETDEANAVVARYGELQAEAARASASAKASVEDDPLLEELGFAPADLDKPGASLSGGERTRLLLAKALAEATPEGVLILDEPTNHLDVEAIEWLEEHLLGFPGTVLFVSHDRAFLDNVATRILAFEEARLSSYPGNYEDYERVRDEDQSRLARLREREEKELQRQKAVIEQFKKQKRFNGQYASRVTRLEKYRAAIDKTPDPLVQKAQLQVAFPASFKSSQDVLRVRGLGKKLGERVLFYGLDLDVVKGDRMALVGPNGAGKTTLLRILTGQEKRDVGTIEAAPGVKGAYFAQGHEQLDVQRTLRAEVLAARPGLEDDDVRALLGRFGFRNPTDHQRKVSSLSGGERSRLGLLKTILTPSNLLILDEPTNHLDIESRRALVGALHAYTGTLLVVSHDRWFLDSVVTKVAVIARRTVKVFVGDFTEARTMQTMGDFSDEKPTTYVVKKGFKDFETGVKHAAGSTLQLTSEEVNAKRLYRTALAMGWMSES